MALSTRTIQDSINWAKRLSFNRNPVIGNSLEPALTSANLVAQVILGPPFEWWWNNLEVSFTCNPTPVAVNSTAAAVAANVLTVTATNAFPVNAQLLISGFTGALKGLNGQIITLVTATPTGFTANVTFANASDTVGTFTNVTTQDYTVIVPNFSHVEHASVLDINPDGTFGKWMEMTTKNELALESSQNRPEFISPHVQDASTGNMTFRVFSAPDKAYPVSIHVQLVAPQFTSINQVWGLPDFMQSVYDWGFLALMWLFADDPRAAYAENKFKAALLARAEGLTEEQKNIFLNNWEELQAGFLMKLQQGIAARSQ